MAFLPAREPGGKERPWLAQMVEHLTRHWVVVSSSLTPGQRFAFYYYITILQIMHVVL